MSVHTIKRWNIKVYWDNETHAFEFSIYDDHLANALSKLREFHFRIDPRSILITADVRDDSQTGYVMGDK